MHADEIDDQVEPAPLLRKTKSLCGAIIRKSWAEARDVYPLLALVRVIHVERKVQVFIPLTPMPEGADYELEGTTLITPAPVDGYTAEERAQIEREYDAGPYIPRR